MIRGKKGFTLIELLIVIVIIGILLGLMYIPSRNSIDSIRERSAINMLVSLIRSTRVDAMNESQDHTLLFQDKTVRINDGSSVKTISLPESLTLKDTASIGFNSAGHPIQSGTIVFINKKGVERRIAVAVGTGRVRAY